ncbi:kinase-like protein [Rickenella mellea]|uniref:Kinase-like protein n=1 Tax=Rickenella mellea TaxID=50990 RepID=A0A4Y7PNH0_9AGAM|nr:kinase-like protein [Rickenella mellea]
MIEKCWARDPNLRPGSKDLVKYFNSRINAAHQSLDSDRQMDPTGRLSEGDISKNHQLTTAPASTSTTTKGLSVSYQPPAPKRRSAGLLDRAPTVTATRTQIVAAAAYNLSTFVSPPVSKRRIHDRRSDLTPPRKRIATGSKHGNAVESTNPSQTGSMATIRLGYECDDKDGHYSIVPHDMIFRRYIIVRLLRQDMCGRVIEAIDTVNNVTVAIRIIRAIPKYRVIGETEIRVMQKLKEHDQDNKNKCIHLLHWFDHQNHICLVSELLEISTYDFLRDNHFQPFPRKHIQDFARQLFGSVAFLHDLHISHTDLKPESILLVWNSYWIACNERKKPQKRILVKTDIRLSDFGSATFEPECHSTTNLTRHYRAPETTLGLGWSYSCDVFSLGCILVEFYTGVTLFQTHDHLAMMKTMGRAQRSSQPATHNEDEGFDSPKSESSTQSEKDKKWRKNLEDLIPPRDPDISARCVGTFVFYVGNTDGRFLREDETKRDERGGN